MRTMIGVQRRAARIRLSHQKSVDYFRSFLLVAI